MRAVTCTPSRSHPNTRTPPFCRPSMAIDRPLSRTGTLRTSQARPRSSFPREPCSRHFSSHSASVSRSLCCARSRVGERRRANAVEKSDETHEGLRVGSYGSDSGGRGKGWTGLHERVRSTTDVAEYPVPGRAGSRNALGTGDATERSLTDQGVPPALPGAFQPVTWVPATSVVLEYYARCSSIELAFPRAPAHPHPNPECHPASRSSRTCSPPTPARTCSRDGSTSIPRTTSRPAIPENDEGDHFDMRDFHVLSMDEVGGQVTDHGVALRVEDMPWAGAQLWSNDAAYKDGTYYLYFPLKDANDVFRIGVATSASPGGAVHGASPSRSRAASASTRACSATTTARTTCTSAACGAGSFSAGARARTTRPCRATRSTTARRSARASRGSSDDMQRFAEPVREIQHPRRERSAPITQQDRERRFFEACWMHRYRGTYYLSTPPATRTCSSTPPATTRTGRSPTAA